MTKDEMAWCFGLAIIEQQFESIVLPFLATSYCSHYNDALTTTWAAAHDPPCFTAQANES